MSLNSTNLTNGLSRGCRVMSEELQNTTAPVLEKKNTSFKGDVFRLVGGAVIAQVIGVIKFTNKILKLTRFAFEGSMTKGVEPARRGIGAIKRQYSQISKINNPLYNFLYTAKDFAKATSNLFKNIFLS